MFLQLSGNVIASGAIDERCVALAVRRDEELNALFPGHICNGGEVPHIHEAVQQATEGASMPPSAFDRCFAALVQSSACGFDGFGVGIDPRDGLHYAFALKSSNSIENCNDGIGSRPDSKDSSDEALSAIQVAVPELDCCCALPVECRREAARESLPTEARSVLDAEQGARQGARHTAKELLRCIRQEQAQTDYCLDPCVFRCLVHTACNRQTEKQGKSLSGAVWSGEALQALQAIAEAHLLGLCKAALLEALHAGRVILLPDDLRRAQAK
jgi:histone H3/H4